MIEFNFDMFCQWPKIYKFCASHTPKFTGHWKYISLNCEKMRNFEIWSQSMPRRVIFLKYHAKFIFVCDLSKNDALKFIFYPKKGTRKNGTYRSSIHSYYPSSGSDNVIFIPGKPCDKPPTLIDGKILDPKQNYSFPDAIKYECNVGFRLAGRSNKVECDRNGNWSKLDAQCNGKIILFFYLFQ